MWGRHECDKTKVHRWPEKVKIIDDIRVHVSKAIRKVMVTSSSIPNSQWDLRDISQLYFQAESNNKWPKIVWFATLRAANHFRLLRSLSFGLYGFHTVAAAAQFAQHLSFFPHRNFCMRSSQLSNKRWIRNYYHMYVVHQLRERMICDGLQWPERDEINDRTAFGAEK